MAVEDTLRRELLEALVERIGVTPADTLMGYLPPPKGWSDVATRQDISSLRTETAGAQAVLRAEMHAGFADVRAEMHAGFADVRAEMADMQAGLRAEMGEFQGGLRAEMADMQAGLRAEMSDLRTEAAAFRESVHVELRKQFYWTMTLMALFLSAYAALTFTAG